MSSVPNKKMKGGLRAKSKCGFVLCSFFWEEIVTKSLATAHFVSGQSIFKYFDGYFRHTPLRNALSLSELIKNYFELELRLRYSYCRDFSSYINPPCEIYLSYIFSAF